MSSMERMWLGHRISDADGHAECFGLPEPVGRRWTPDAGSAWGELTHPVEGALWPPAPWPHSIWGPEKPPAINGQVKTVIDNVWCEATFALR